MRRAISFAVNVNRKRKRLKRMGSEQVNVPKIAIPKPMLGICLLNNEIVEYQLDSGADLSVVDEQVYKRLKPQPQLKASIYDFETADKRNMEVLGVIEVVWKLGEQEKVVHIQSVSLIYYFSLSFF